MATIKVRRTLISEAPRKNSLLLALFFVAFILLTSTLCWNEGGQTCVRWASSTNVFETGEWWRLFTGTLVHRDLRHFLSNALVFGLFAHLLYGYFGPLVFPVSTFLAGGLVNLLSLLTYLPNDVRLVGASGMVYFMAGVWLTMYLLIERRHTVSKRLLHVVGFGILVLVPTSADPSVSHRAHAFGFLIGVVFAVLLFTATKEKIRSRELLEIQYEPGEALTEPLVDRQPDFREKETDDGIRL